MECLALRRDYVLNYDTKLRKGSPSYTEMIFPAFCESPGSLENFEATLHYRTPRNEVSLMSFIIVAIKETHLKVIWKGRLKS